MAETEGDLLEFYGTECVHCRTMAPLVEMLQDELKVKVTRYEVWHNQENARLLEKYDKGFCGGVPFFYNKKTGKWICGSVPYEKFKAWAEGKD